MTGHELLDELNALPEDALRREVICDDDSGFYMETKSVELQRLKLAADGTDDVIVIKGYP